MKKRRPPASILVVDIGGTKVKVLATGQTEPRKAPSGKKFTPARMVEVVRELATDWEYEAVSVGYPGLVGVHGPRSEPGNLAPGWVGFDFAAAFDLPVRIINDAAMQALGCYEGGRMLFLGLGTGLGSALIAENVVVPLELGLLKHPEGKILGDVVSRQSLRERGRKAWAAAVREAVSVLAAAFTVDYVVLGGGNASKVGSRGLPPGIRLGSNLAAFRGGQRLWNLEDVATLSTEEAPAQPGRKPADWRVI